MQYELTTPQSCQRAGIGEPPDTFIEARPEEVSLSRTAAVRFGSNEPGSFECSG